MALFIRNFLAATLMLVSLSGCFFGLLGGDDPAPSGNGDGYHGVIGRYYRVKPGYQCTTADGVTKRTYRDLILTFDDGTYVQLGDGCSTTEKSSGQTSSLDLKNDILGFQNGIYQKGN